MPRRSLLVRLLLAALAVPLVGGCGDSALPQEYETTGIDGLEIPTPSPDPHDFVTAVTNPWLPYEAGRSWRYRVSGGLGPDPAELVVRVETETEEVAGVESTVVTHTLTTSTGRVAEEGTAYFAQDGDGNVWLLGSDTATRADGGELETETAWRAGVDGAEAGLAMPAEPRVGDGFRAGFAEGSFEDVLTVRSVDAAVAVAAGLWEDALEVERTSPLDGNVAVTTYAQGTGPGLVEVSGERPRRIELVTPPAG